VTGQHLPGIDELLARFRTFRYSCFRLETLQSYSGSGEDEQLAAFGRGEPYVEDDAEREWAAMLRANRDAGKTQQRVHVVREPISDYLAYELTWEYGPHVAAGEDIRIIAAEPEGGWWPVNVPLRRDCWLFDSREVFELHYGDDGTWYGVTRGVDPATAAEAGFIRDAALHQAVPWCDYLARHPTLARRLP
jgi:hypothetical protein